MISRLFFFKTCICPWGVFFAVKEKRCHLFVLAQLLLLRVDSWFILPFFHSLPLTLHLSPDNTPWPVLDKRSWSACVFLVPLTSLGQMFVFPSLRACVSPCTCSLITGCGRCWVSRWSSLLATGRGGDVRQRRGLRLIPSPLLANIDPEY